MDNAIQISDVQKNSTELWRLFGTVPFGMSDYQIKEFVLSHFTDSRSQRQVLLEISVRAKSLCEGECLRDRMLIELRKLERQTRNNTQELEAVKKELAECKEEGEVRETLEDRIANIQDEIDLAEVDTREKTFTLHMQEKHVEDAMRECQVLIDFLGQLTLVDSREEFEKMEREYWILRATNDAKLEAMTGVLPSKGTLELLQNLRLDVPKVVVDTLETVKAENVVALDEHSKEQKQLSASASSDEKK